MKKKAINKTNFMPEWEEGKVKEDLLPVNPAYA
jgi:hypothetical protein